VAAESEVLKNSLNINDYPESWLSMEYGAYDWKNGAYVEMDSGGWVTPTKEITAYFMDPRNFLDFTYIFQFEDLLYSDKHTVTGLKAILPTKYDGYAEDLLSAARDANVSAYHLATRMTQEGTKIDGTWPGYEGYYNFFNIGAYAHSGNGAVTNGAIYAKKQGWDTPYKCILGSAQQLGKNYIHKNQNTIYHQKFNVAGENLYSHQYMSNINAPASESKIRSNKATPEELKNGMTFIIPVYKEMPAIISPKPSETGNNNNFLDSLTVEGFAISPTFDRYKME
jgi:beta-N-acetylglucosaminidase